MNHELDPNILVPKLRMIFDKTGHQGNAIGIIQDLDRNSPRFKVGLWPLEGAVLSYNDARDLIEKCGSTSHSARRQRRVKGGFAIIACLQAPGVFQTIHFGVENRATSLNAPVV